MSGNMCWNKCNNVGINSLLYLEDCEESEFFVAFIADVIFVCSVIVYDCPNKSHFIKYWDCSVYLIMSVILMAVQIQKDHFDMLKAYLKCWK